MSVQPIDTIRNYHAHIYFDGPAQRGVAEALREEIAQRFSVLLGNWHDRLVGPHLRPMYQVAFATAEFARFVPWLMINRRGLAVLIHPNTGHPKPDHLRKTARNVRNLMDQPTSNKEKHPSNSNAKLPAHFSQPTKHVASRSIHREIITTQLPDNLHRRIGP